MKNTKKKTKHDVALFHEFLVLKGEMKQTDKFTPKELNKFLSEFLIRRRRGISNFGFCYGLHFLRQWTYC